MAEAVVSKAFVGKFYLEIGDGNSPQAYARYCEITDLKGLGVKNDQVEVTTFCSGGRKEYISGLGDGSEMTFGANYSLDEPIQEGLMDDVDDKVNRDFQVVVGDDSPHRLFSGTLAMLSYDIAPSVSKQNVVTFVGKQTGLLVRGA